MSEEQPQQPEAVPAQQGGVPTHEPQPMEPVPVGEQELRPSDQTPDGDGPEAQQTEETEEEKELRELREAAVRGELILSVEQARRWQHELGLPDAALPANDNESQQQQ